MAYSIFITALCNALQCFAVFALLEPGQQPPYPWDIANVDECKRKIELILTVYDDDNNDIKLLNYARKTLCRHIAKLGDTVADRLIKCYEEDQHYRTASGLESIIYQNPIRSPKLVKAAEAYITAGKNQTFVGPCRVLASIQPDSPVLAKLCNEFIAMADPNKQYNDEADYAANYMMLSSKCDPKYLRLWISTLKGRLSIGTQEMEMLEILAYVVYEKPDSRKLQVELTTEFEALRKRRDIELRAKTRLCLDYLFVMQGRNKDKLIEQYSKETKALTGFANDDSIYVRSAALRLLSYSCNDKELLTKLCQGEWVRDEYTSKLLREKIASLK